MNAPNAFPITRQGYNLLHQGALTLSKVEANGIRIDVGKLNNQIKVLGKKKIEYEKEIKNSEVWKLIRKRFGGKASIGSHEQWGEVLFGQMGFESPESKEVTTKGGITKTRYKSDETALRSVDHPIVNTFFKWAKIDKAVGTYLTGILRETHNGFLHPFFNLHIATTYRSSSSDPNFQNQPVRMPQMAEWIRGVMMPRKNHSLLEIDYSGIEVAIAACYHNDPTMLDYITNPKNDMHRDMAGQIYMLMTKEIHKMARYAAKNMFVFPEFYGDWWGSCAKSLWEAIDRLKLQTVSGVPLKEHLQKKGITKLGDLKNPLPGTFFHHLKEVEQDFWGNRFQVYGQWKKDWFSKYQDQGYFDTLTGFRLFGEFNRKEVINYPVQGTAFHCLLWALIQAQKEIEKSKMNAYLVGQVHDSMIGDVHYKEVEDYLFMVQEIMVEKIKKWAPWLTVPLSIEADITPINQSWFHKQAVDFSEEGFAWKDQKFETMLQLFKHWRKAA